VTNAGHILILPGATMQAGVIMQSGAAALTRVDGTIFEGGSITVSGGSLSGTGSVQVDVAHTTGNINLATMVSPGSGDGHGNIGALSAIANNIIFQTGSHYQVDLSGASAADLLQITGNLDLSAAGNFLDISALTPLTGTSYLVATYTGSLTGTFDNVTSGYQVSYATPGQVLVIIPEPTGGAAALAAISATGFLTRRRRKPRGAAATQT
jgi:hypothetical protein